MSARQRLLGLLAHPPRDTTGPWLDLVAGRPGSRGRLQDAWQSEGGAGGYDGLLAVGDQIEGLVPDLLGGRNLRAFYRVDERLGLIGGETVLDLACGPGTLTRRLARAVGRDGLVIAADLSVPMLTRAARSTPFACVDFARVDAMDLPLRDGSVDAVSCSLCLHLVPDLGTTLEEMARVLRPGGPVAIAVPSHAPGPFRAVTETLARFGQARVFGPGELSREMRSRGWDGVQERSLGGIRIVDATAPF
ncbi:methyltransferase domain-containing protein [Actinomycetospora sp. TBRC 11914]|uniref:class I SAM-dependent methyltransferase n=1 Tax=Actinomycetospora sp. TBRC 11914 TaxID=2729387 RepID=UPI00145D77E4|nr:methyltransferase domain-containing protein [Actinomycetospora sp. TBRC 11914]NMO89257.1 methyltransferase domain-containing protein [Actinomycetospora sp. TBRC 11914]